MLCTLWNLFFSVKQKSGRKKKYPRKYNIFWDMNIPTEYYEEEFIEFEKYLEFTNVKKEANCQDPQANADYYLQQFQIFEKFRKAEQLKAYHADQKKKKRNAAKSTSVPVKVKGVVSKHKSNDAVQAKNPLDSKVIFFLLLINV